MHATTPSHTHAHIVSQTERCETLISVVNNAERLSISDREGGGRDNNMEERDSRGDYRSPKSQGNDNALHWRFGGRFSAAVIVI